METFFTEYLSRLDDIFNGIIEAVSELPQEALDWEPGENISTINVLIAHTAGTTRFWIGDMAVGDPKPRDRAAEFATKGLTVADIKARIEEIRAYAHSAVGRMTLADLDKVYSSTNHDGDTRT